MDINEIFKKYTVNYKKLEEFGFIKENDNYTYSSVFFDNNFKCIITIDKNGNIKDKVIDLDTNELYLNIRIKNGNAFINKVQEKYKEILYKIRENCFIEKYFVYDTSNKLCKFIYSKYKDKPEFLWKNSSHGVFRNKRNKKWYAIIMNIDGKYINREGNIEIINVKIDDAKLSDLLKIKGIYKAYHMNKKKWISILLDESIDIDMIYKLITDSYDLINKLK
ncbi:MAG: MmcQ/YjbR family DNA-binding protein [Bacilli bacterium]|nr:MmcQ/YjbR family DNA-binding protein [Bacilli bacterium]